MLRTRTLIILALMGAALMYAGTMALGAQLAHAADYTEAGHHSCGNGYVVKYEDDYCFAWSKHGNLQRGLYVVGRKDLRIVGVCAFAKLWRQDRIDWDRSAPLRGDFHARHLARVRGCNR